MASFEKIDARALKKRDKVVSIFFPDTLYFYRVGNNFSGTSRSDRGLTSVMCLGAS